MATWSNKEEIACVLSVDGKEKKFTLKANELFTYNFTPQSKDIALNRSCNGEVMGDVQISYIPENLHDVVSTAE